MMKNIFVILSCVVFMFVGSNLSEAFTVEEAYLSIPHRRTVFDEEQARMTRSEKTYFRNFFGLIDEAIVERVSMMKYLTTQGRMGRLTNKYDRLLKDLEKLSVPDHLLQAHVLVIEAIKEQRIFLGKWKNQGDEASINMLQDQHVLSAHQRLLQAYQILISTFPKEGGHNKQAFFDYLCALDFI